MKMRKRRKQFWKVWHADTDHIYSLIYGYFDWGIGRIKHQIKNKIK